jgi:hypothetical protein
VVAQTIFIVAWRLGAHQRDGDAAGCDALGAGQIKIGTLPLTVLIDGVKRGCVMIRPRTSSMWERPNRVRPPRTVNLK